MTRPDESGSTDMLLVWTRAYLKEFAGQGHSFLWYPRIVAEAISDGVLTPLGLTRRPNPPTSASQTTTSLLASPPTGCGSVTLPGTPFLYYGEEVGLRDGPGGADEWKRTPMPWTAGEGGAGGVAPALTGQPPPGSGAP